MKESKRYDFIYSEWANSYPELQNYFPVKSVENIAKQAAIYFNSTKTGVVCCPEERQIIFHLLVSHIVYLRKKNTDGNNLNGPISSVSEGAVSVSVDTSNLGKIDPWLATSPYGIEFWALTKKYRSTFYIRPIPDPRLRIWP